MVNILIERNDPKREELFPLLGPIPGARLIFDLNVHILQTSCAMPLPLLDYIEKREQLNIWPTEKGILEKKSISQKKNQKSIDGKPTNIIEKDSE